MFTRIRCALKREMLKHPAVYNSIHRLHAFLLAKFIALRWPVHKIFTRFNRNGLNKTERRTPRIIVSLTSYPARINEVPYAIASLLNQTMKPDKIILWLGTGKFPGNELPPIFRKLKQCGVDIEFREDLGPHTKYFYAVKEYPDDIVITFDDDHIYDRNIIETLYRSYTKHPECVSAMLCEKYSFSEDNSECYADLWETVCDTVGEPSFQYQAEGVGGVLYPPHSIHEEVFNVEAMKRLSPKNDDIWLKFMEVINGTKVVPARLIPKFYGKLIMGWCIPSSQATALTATNFRGGNDRQMRAVTEAYNNWFNDGRTLLAIMNEGK